MAYPFVQAYHDYGRRRGPVLAFVVHMAEGGGTVGYLAKAQSRGVSVHYVIEYSGRIVQMLREDHASGSIDPTKIRTTNGPAPYGAAVRRQVMRSWDSDPNSVVISLEIEGFAKDGPNVSQLQALSRLVDDVRSRSPAIGLLGHRDFADYKACPGARIPWTILGGHGPASEADMAALYFQRSGPGRFTVPAGVSVRGWRPTASGWAVDRTWSARDTPSTAHYSAHLVTSADSPPTSVLFVDSGFFAGTYVSTADVIGETPDPPDAQGDCEAAIAADRATARIVWGD